MHVFTFLALISVPLLIAGGLFFWITDGGGDLAKLKGALSKLKASLNKLTAPKPPKNSAIQIEVTTTFYHSGTFDSEDDQEREYDNWEGSFWEVEDPIPAKATLLIKYTDGDGVASERTVDVRQVGPTPYGALLIGRCQLRNATRTFRTDRINHCVDAETGEIIEDVYAYLRNRYQSSPDYTLDQLLDNEYDVLRVLLYVGKADGQLRAPEREAIAEACKAITSDNRISADQVKNLLNRVDLPSLHTFKIAVGNINKRQDQQLKSTVMLAAKAIVATQKTVSPGEQEALDYMAKRFASDA